ncbi:MAG: ABC transporter substrate-binding protein [Halobacteriaceae archaeon]
MKLAGGATAAAATSSAGCLGLTGGGGGAANEVDIPDNPDEEVDGTSIVHAMDSGHNTNPFRWFQDEIQQETGVTLSNIQGYGFSELPEKLRTEFNAGSGAFDLVGYYPQYMGTFAANGHIVPLDNMMEVSGWSPAMDDTLKPFREIYTQWGGNTYALPIDGDVLILVYRKDLFEEHNQSVPKTWSEFNQVAKYFTENASDVEYGVATYGSRGFCYGWFLTRFGGAGGIYFDEDMNPQINTEAGRMALESWKETLQYADPQSASYGYAGLRDAFLNERVAMVVQWTDVPKKAAASKRVSGKWGAAPVPGFEGKTAASAMPVGRVLSVPAYTSNTKQLAAYRFAQQMTINKFSKHMVSDPGCGEDPFRNGHFEDPAIYTQQNQYREFSGDAAPEDSIAFPTMAAAREYANAVQKTLQQGYPEPYWPGAPQYIEELSVEMSKFVAGDQGVDTTLQNVEDSWNSTVEELGREQQKEYYQNVIQAWKNAGLWN